MIGNRHSRRGFLKGVAGAGAVAAAGLAGTRAVSAQSAGDSVQTILNLAATMEALSVTHVYGLLTMRKFELTPAEQLQARILLDAEFKHLDLIVNAGGQPQDTSFFVPAGVYDTRQRFGQITTEVELVCTAAYLAATRRLAELGEHRMAGTMAQLAANEAQHAAVSRDLIGAVPSDNAWLPAFFYNVSDAAPVIAPFLNGGQGFQGPMEFPGLERVQQVLGSTRAIAFPTFLNSF